jgi:Zn-dependent peptidase ImmA (M78 family)
MAKLKDQKLGSEKVQRTESVLDTLETAFTTELDDTSDPAVANLREPEELLPAHLQDPFAVIEKGRALLQTGIPVQQFRPDVAFDNELRMAARNGKPVPKDVRDLMDTERAHAEATANQQSAPRNPQIPVKISNDNQCMMVTDASANEATRDQEVEELACLLAAESEHLGKVDLLGIASAYGITYSFGHYLDYFDGLLECRNRQFHIFLNLDTNRGAESPRARFSFAHELGHYFLDWHRCALDRGVPPHGSRADFESGNLAEREADMFAANLLLPANEMRKVAHRRIDAPEIARLSQHFCTSLSATAIRCARLSLSPLIVMRWTATMRAWCWSSNEFEQRTDNKAFRSIERLPLDSATRETLGCALSKREFIVTKGTTLATWFPNIRAGSSFDDIMIEECISLGPHGALTILRPS